MPSLEAIINFIYAILNIVLLVRNDSVSDSLTTKALGIIALAPGSQYEVYSVYKFYFRLTLDEL